MKRGVLFTDESRFSLYRADGRRCVWHRVGERFADVNVVDRVAHGGGEVMVWAGICYQQCWGKLLLKVMHYNIASLSKKVTNYGT